MTATAAQAVARFEQLLGTREHPAGSNHVPGITDFLHTASGYGTGDSPWCAESVSRVLSDVGIHDFYGHQFANGIAYVPLITELAHQTGRFILPANTQPGDVEIFVWGGAGSCPQGDHTGMRCEADSARYSIEGNSGGPDGVDEVAYHAQLNRAPFLIGAYRPTYGQPQPVPKPRPSNPPVPPKPAPGQPPLHHMIYLTSPHLMTGPDVLAWQKRMARRPGWGGRIGALDGQFGPMCANACLAWQNDCDRNGFNVGVPDSILGPLTWHASWARP